MPLIAAYTPSDVDIHHTDELVDPRPPYGKAVTIATRGCVHQCGYCAIPFMYGRGQRRRPVNEVAHEASLMPGKAVVFWDDFLTQRPTVDFDAPGADSFSLMGYSA